MNTILKLLPGVALLPVSLFGQEMPDSIDTYWDQQLKLNEVVVIANRPVMKQTEGKLVYLVKNDPYAKGLDGISLLDRIPRVSVNNGTVNVAGKGNVRYIIDGILMELDASALAMRLQNLRAENVEKIELLATPPSRYATEPNAAYISITTRNETLGTKGSVYGSLNQGDKLSENFSGSVSHTTRRVEMSLDANIINIQAINDNYIEYQFADHSRRSSTRNGSHLFNTGANAIFKYKVSADMNLGVIANYNYESSISNGSNTTDYDQFCSTSYSHTKSRPNNALTATGFYDWTFGNNGERLELTYNYFNRHSPTNSYISTNYSNGLIDSQINEKGESDYRFHSAKVDFRFPYPWLQMETGIGYTDILSSSDNFMEYYQRSVTSNRFDYSERIAAAYFSASRALGKGFWGKMGLRYEYTWTDSKQLSLSKFSKESYGHLFPTLNLSWTKGNIGSFNLSLSMGMGRPNLWELNPFRYYSTSEEYAAGNAYLKPTIYNNAEINYYGLGGLYAVIYTSSASDAIGYIRSVEADGTVSTMPYNCLSTNKTGVYATYKRNISGRWEVNVGGEIFRSYSRSSMPDFRFSKLDDWSGKLEMSTNVMLNRQKTLIFNARFTHFFPWQQNMVNYKSFQLFNASIRYSLLNNRLNLRLTANDIFGWNKTRSKEHYADYVIKQTFNAHTSYISLGISCSFGRDKVNGVWRASKEDQSRRTK